MRILSTAMEVILNLHGLPWTTNSYYSLSLDSYSSYSWLLVIFCHNFLFLQFISKVYFINKLLIQSVACFISISSVQSLSHVQLFVTPWTAACQASLSITNSWSLFKLMSIRLVMLANHLILCCPLLFLPSIIPSIRIFPMNQCFASGGQSIEASTSASVLPINNQDWFPVGSTGWISLQSKGLIRVFSNTTV